MIRKDMSIFLNKMNIKLFLDMSRFSYQKVTPYDEVQQYVLFFHIVYNHKKSTTINIPNVSSILTYKH